MSQMRVTMSQIIPVIVKNTLMLSYGMMSSYPAILIPSLSNRNLNETIYLNEEQISWIGSINMLSLPLGCLLSGIVSQAIGRKLTMQISSALMIVSWLIFKFCNDVWQIYVALVLFGLTGGLLESPILTYAAEITEPRLRGSLLSTTPLFATLGMFLEFLLGSQFHWREVCLYSSIPSFASLILLFIVPESPMWLVMKNKMDKARRSLAWVRGWNKVTAIEQEFQDIVITCSKDQLSKQKNVNIVNYTKMEFIHPFLLIFYLFILHYFCGLTTIQTYIIKILETLDVPMDEYNAAIIFGLLQFVGCVVYMVIVPYLGRRVTAFISIIIAALSLAIVATYAHLANKKYIFIENEPSEINYSEYSWVALTFILLEIFILNCGVRALPWTLIGECFNSHIRATATGILSAIAHLIGFVSNKTFLNTVAVFTLSGVFLFYIAVGLISLVILYFWLPETEGKSLQEINNHFAGKLRLDNRVGRQRESKDDKNVNI